MTVSPLRPIAELATHLRNGETTAVALLEQFLYESASDIACCTSYENSHGIVV